MTFRDMKEFAAGEGGKIQRQSEYGKHRATKELIEVCEYLILEISKVWLSVVLANGRGEPSGLVMLCSLYMFFWFQ